jgi:hypothetical protein
VQLHQIIYLSKLTDKNENFLPEILNTAIWHNQRNNITGMMLYSNGDILQVLEGDDASIHNLFQRIALDKRHSEVFTVIDEPIGNRCFDQWSMGYRKIVSSHDLERLSHYRALFQSTPSELTTRARRGPALEVMQSFSAWAMG